MLGQAELPQPGWLVSSLVQVDHDRHALLRQRSQASSPPGIRTGNTLVGEKPVPAVDDNPDAPEDAGETTKVDRSHSPLCRD